MSSQMAGIAATWSMPKVGAVSERVGSESIILEETTESVMNPDLRSRVDPKDFADGGKYRCRYSPSLVPCLAVASCHRLLLGILGSSQQALQIDPDFKLTSA